MRFGLLGPVEVSGEDGRLVAVGGPRVRSLLALLALNAGRIVTVEALVDGLYGALPPADAANALQSQVSRLRRALTGVRVEYTPAGYRLAVDPESVDVHRFTRLATAGREAHDPERARDLLGEALALWRGPALADLADAPFARGQAARLEELRLAAAEDHAEARLSLGEFREAVPELRELVAANPLRERARGLLMRSLYASGRQAEALADFEEIRTLLADELGTDPSPGLAAVHLAILRGDPAAPETRAENARAGEAEGSRLPAPVSSFVGRAEELERVGRLLADGRLVTLLGPGGAGKTRLAVEAAGRYGGEARFVDLAAIVAGGEVPSATLSALGVRESRVLDATPGQADPVTRLTEALAGRRMLLVFDNCEHVLDDAARLVRGLLGACPGLRVLATSREALAITGEVVCPLAPLPLPEGPVPAEEAARYPGVRLFAERAAAVRPGFEVSDDLAAVLEICRSLDGLPLAIELAAARLRTLSAGEVAARLGGDDRFRLLSRGDRTAAPRHQTLRAVVEWSWDLLAEPERTLARRLTVFTGGATAEAAATVSGLHPDDTADLLADLAEKSLVERVGGRYRMLDTIRAFCAERLAESGEEDRMRRAHLDYFLALAERADPHLRADEQVEWLDRLTAEHGNMHAALRWSIGHAPRPGLRLVALLSWYWWMRGQRGEGSPLAAELVAAVGPEPPGGLEEEYALCLLNVLYGQSGEDERRRTIDRVNAIMVGLSRAPRLPFTTILWALASGPPSDVEVRDVQGRFGDDDWSRGLEPLGAGMVAYIRGDLATADRELRVALERFGAMGDRWGMGQALDTLATLAAWRGDHDESISLLSRALDLVTELDSVEDMATLLCRRGEFLARTGDLEAARADFERGGRLARQMGITAYQALATSGLGDVDRLRGDLEGARRRYQEALDQVSALWFMGNEPRTKALVGLGRLAVAEGAPERARELFGQAVEGAMAYRFLPIVSMAVEGFADAALAEGDGELAARLLGAAVAVRGGTVAGDPDVARTAAEAGRLVGKGRYASAYRSGTALSQEEVLALIGASTTT
jgi:predicted ATPase/DNA-binding SARP family transcriptional activator